MKSVIKKSMAVLMLAMTVCLFIVPVHAEEQAQLYTAEIAETETIEPEQAATGSKAIAASIAIGLSAAAGAVAMGIAIAKSAEGISRQPEVEDKIRTNLMLGLVFIETAIIYALIIAILIIFVL